MKNEFVVLKNETTLYKVRRDEILSISVHSGIVTFLLENHTKIHKTMTLREVMTLLPEHIRINRNCTVHSDKIKAVCKKTRTITLANGEIYKASYRNIANICCTLN